MGSRVRVSVIVPVYNNARGIKEAVECLSRQTFDKKQLEIIIIDNGSSDQTPQVMLELQDRYRGLKYAREERSNDSYLARNKGIGMAAGGIIAFTDSDCMPAPNWVEEGVGAFDRENIDYGGGDVLFTFEGNRPNIFEYYNSAHSLQQERYVNKYGFCVTANCFVKKEILDRYGQFRIDMFSGADAEFGIRIKKSGINCVFIPNAIVWHQARSSFTQLFKRTKRVAQGQRKLRLLGALPRRRLTARDILPTLVYRRNSKFPAELSRMQNLQLVFLRNIFRWVDIYYRNF